MRRVTKTNACRFATAAVLSIAIAQAASTPKPVDDVIRDYAKAVGGLPAVDRISTREVKANHKTTYYWQAPNKVLRVRGREKIAFDGGSGWVFSKKKHVSRLPKGAELALEVDANPLRYVRLRGLYEDLEAAPAEELDSEKMDVLRSPNNLGATKFYFNAQDHFLKRVEELGETSAYYKNVIEFFDYKQVDDIKLPARIVHISSAPGGRKKVTKISRIKQNVKLNAEIFERPKAVAVTLGGKR